MLREKILLPEHYEIERELREQLSGRPGHQRCVVGHSELLLVLHDVPKAGVPEREAIFFWRRLNGSWFQPCGEPGLHEAEGLLERYTKVIDKNEEELEGAETAGEIFVILREAGPLARSSRNLVEALKQALVQEPEDRAIRFLLDRARELERAAELLQADARETLLFLQAEAAEDHAQSAYRLEKILFRLSLLNGFFLPLVALGSLFGMNVKLPGFVDGLFWLIFVAGLLFGAGLLWYVVRNMDKGSR
ncbi:MAG: CorA family divalent cation transporter [Luteolibacter sp.]